VNEGFVEVKNQGFLLTLARGALPKEITVSRNTPVIVLSISSNSVIVCLICSRSSLLLQRRRHRFRGSFGVLL
jgi:hypothetical protein